MLAFIRNVSFVVEWERHSNGICETALLCLEAQMVLRVVYVHVEKLWKHVLVSSSGQRLQRGEGHWVDQMVCLLWLPIYWP